MTPLAPAILYPLIACVAVGVIFVAPFIQAAICAARMEREGGWE